MRKILAVLLASGLATVHVPAMGAEASISKAIGRHKLCYDNGIKVTFGPGNRYKAVHVGKVFEGQYEFVTGGITYDRLTIDGQPNEMTRSVQLSIDGNHFTENGQSTGTLCR